MSRPVEDTVTQLLVSYLQRMGFNVRFKASIDLPRNRRGEPDIKIENGGTFYGEAEWEDSEIEGFAQARDYGEAHEASGSFVIIYPNKLKEEIEQKRIEKVYPESVLSGYKFRVAFMRKGFRTDMRRLSLQEIEKWMKRNILDKKPEPPDKSEVIKLMRKLATALTKELGDIKRKPMLFRNILGEKPSKKEVIEATRNAAGFLLVNQLTFYRVLSAYKDFSDIDVDSLDDLNDLHKKYFSKVLEENYTPVFSYNVASEFSRKSLTLIKNTIKTIYAITPEHIDLDVLGKVFHELIPLSIRKQVAAYYTKTESANILVELAINKPNLKILDLACGSGTLLVSAYKRKKELVEKKSKFTEKDHKRFLEKDITGIDIMPFAAHLSVINLALQAPLYQTDEVRVGIEDSTKLKPGKSILPLSRILPEARRQRTLREFKIKEEELIESGAITLDGKPGKKIDLNKADLVIMNPPFTRQERLSKESKLILSKRFNEYKKYLGGQLSYYGYFILLADRFLKKNGRVALVLPTTFLSKKHTEGIRKFLSDNYHIEYVILNHEVLSFSESTFFREILLIAKKGRSKKDAKTKIIFLKRIPKTDKETKKIIKQIIITNSNFENKQLVIKVVKYAKLKSDFKSWYKYTNFIDIPLIEFIENLFNSTLFIPFSKFLAEMPRVDLVDMKFKKFHGFVLYNRKRAIRKDDIWIIESEGRKKIVALHRYRNKKIEIPFKSLKRGLRRTSYVNNIDITKSSDYLVISSFKNLKNMTEELLTNKELNILNRTIIHEWKKVFEKRKTHLIVSRRSYLASPGTSLIAFCSEYPVIGIDTWCVQNITREQAKILVLWLNSSLSVVQFINMGLDAEGPWTKIDGRALKQLFIPNIKKLSEKNKSKLLDVYNKVKNKKFPSIFEQFKASNPARRLIDKTWLEMFNVKNPDLILNKLYDNLTKELELLQNLS